MTNGSKLGKIIIIDGPDGVGKSTQIKLTKDWLESEGHSVFATRASGGTGIGKLLRKASLSDNPRTPEVDVYISLAMHTSVGAEINKQKKSGQIVLVDRSPLAIVAYNTFGSNLDNKRFGFESFEKMMKTVGYRHSTVHNRQAINIRRTTKQTHR